MQLHDSLICNGVITSPFIQTAVWDAIEIACHNSVNIVKRKMPQIADKCLVFGMFAWHINIDKLKVKLWP